MADANLIVKRGDDFKVIVTLSANGVPMDLSNYTARAQIRASTDPAAALIAEFTVEIVEPAEDGVINMVLEHSKTLTLAGGKWDLEITDTINEWVTTVTGGTVTVSPDVTRDIV